MIKTDLIDVVNSGNAWAFIGSGISVDAGSLSWKMLLDNILKSIDNDQREQIESQSKFAKNYKVGSFSQCFSVIELYIGRPALEKVVINELRNVTLAGKLAQRMADLPFKAYITTNYDFLIESALEELGHRGWLSVGNTKEESAKVSGGASNVVWHVHGATELDNTKSRMILTQEDYDSIYLHPSPVYEQLKSVLSQHRIVFIGFSFQDAEVVRLLKVVGDMCTPDRPAYAFLSDISGSEHYSERMDLRLKHNIEVIPYTTVGSSHKRLHELLDVYEAMILRRRLRFGQALREAPSYTEEATGLLLYNELSLKQHEGVSAEISESLLKSRILSILRFRSRVNVAEFITELGERVRLLQGGSKFKADIEMLIRETVKALAEENLIQFDTQDGVVTLTDKGKELVLQQSGIAERFHDQFIASLNSRASQLLPLNPVAGGEIASLAGAFIKESVKKHSLGVALVQNNPTKPQQEYQMIALLKSLPEYIEQAASQEEAVALIHLIQDILSSPNSIERNYIGLNLQAQFGVHLLGFDQATVQLRVEQIQKTLFLIDSSTLIPFLSRSCVGYEPARRVISLLKASGAAVVTTALLSAEVAEHACWAINNAGKKNESLKAYLVSMGNAGFGSNAFLEGFLEEVRQGVMPPNINTYLMEVCDKRYDSEICSDDAIVKALTRHGLPVNNFAEWKGFAPEYYEMRDDYTNKIAELRKEAGNFKHFRQVKAEAEALIIIRMLREKIFSYEDKSISDAFFVSNTRIINQLDSGGNPITINADSIIQWLSTMARLDPTELGFLYDGMLWELHEKGFNIVDREKLRSVFGPLIHASKEKIEELIDNHKVLITEIYGANAEKAFRESDELYSPLILESIQSKRAERLEVKLSEERALKQKVMERANLTEKEKKELSILRHDKKRREAKGKSQKRAANSKPKKKKKKH